ncbi:unnamed protein product [Meloidogyne enterolobii]|uniref:Uncharacterized protein n=1 Tax=Meloidogyne enterolobii TaxID=390850 RepID=A0ACB0XZH2_MELEN
MAKENSTTFKEILKNFKNSKETPQTPKNSLKSKKYPENQQIPRNLKKTPSKFKEKPLKIQRIFKITKSANIQNLKKTLLKIQIISKNPSKSNKIFNMTDQKTQFSFSYPNLSFLILKRLTRDKKAFFCFHF